MVDSRNMIDLTSWLLPDTAAQAGPWAAIRRPPRHSDESLTGTTRQWLRRLPAGRRPLHLCTQFPRVANRIAWCWRDTTLTNQVLDDLLIDRRGGRAGFPRPVVIELRRLRDFNERSSSSEASGGAWTTLRQFWTRH
jgi:hypothetical protein